MLDFKEQNDKERAFFEQDFSAINEILQSSLYCDIIIFKERYYIYEYFTY